MERLKNSGFYKLKFLITPEEFNQMLARFEQKQAKFHRTNHAMTQDDLDQVLEADAMREQKPAVRISQHAVNDLIDSWIVREYGLVMNNKKDISGT